MVRIQDDIKNNSFRRAYLLFGEEDYLRNLYKKKLSDAIVPESDNMNRTYLYERDASEEKIMELSETLPFMSERRLILIEDSGFFKNGMSDGFLEYLERIPEETVLIFSESVVDKKRKPYKALDRLDGLVECKKPSDKEIASWIAGELSKNGKKIRSSTADFLLERAGSDMYLLKNEIDKLASFSGDREEITRDDIISVSSVNIQNSIFTMIDDIAEGRQKKALEKYYELLLLKEPPMRILYLLSKEFNRLLLIKELSVKKAGWKEMASAIKVPEFAVRKYVSAAENYTKHEILYAVEDCLKTEDDVKKGRIDDRLGTELLIIRYSGREREVKNA